MKAILDFNRTIMLMPKFWIGWLGVLMALNMVAPLFFLNTAEGWTVVLLFLGMATFLMGLFGKLGWVRLLGIAHFPWFGLLPWLWLRLETLPGGSALAYWLTVLLAVNAVSLLIDVVDVVRYMLGDRAPRYRLP